MLRSKIAGRMIYKDQTLFNRHAAAQRSGIRRNAAGMRRAPINFSGCRRLRSRTREAEPPRLRTAKPEPCPARLASLRRKAVERDLHQWPIRVRRNAGSRGHFGGDIGGFIGSANITLDAVTVFQSIRSRQQYSFSAACRFRHSP